MINAFATPIFNFKLGEDAEKILDDIKDYLLKEEKKKKDSDPKFSLKGKNGWHSPDNLAYLDYSWSNSLRETLLGLAESYSYEIKSPVGIHRDLVRVSCWGMLIRKGDMSTPHTHPNSLSSGTIWIDVPEDMDDGGKLCFLDPRGGARNDVTFGSTSMDFNPERRAGVVFPSWLDHYVTPHNSDSTRISIAWNIQPTMRYK